MVSIRAITMGGSIDKIYCGKASDFIVGDPCLCDVLEAGNCSTMDQNESQTTTNNNNKQQQIDWTTEEVCRKDSLLIDEEDRNILMSSIEKSVETKIIVTHGTDTMWKSAAFVNVLAKRLGKTIVFTGAMKPAAFKESDAGFNVGTAVCAVQLLASGAHVVMNGEIFSNPLRIYKDFERNRFYEGDQDRNLTNE